MINAVTHTLIYASIFNHPLTVNEIFRYLISSQSLSIINLKTLLDESPCITRFEGTPIRFSITRIDNWSNEKHDRAWNLINLSLSTVLNILSKVPSICMIAISGSTAALSIEQNSDVDLFIICKKNTKWITRVAIILLFYILGNRFNVNKKTSSIKPSFCANLIIENDSQSLEFQPRDLFTAMEIAHLKVLVDKQQTFAKFLLANTWINNFLPNFWKLANHEWDLDSYQSKQPDRTRNRILTLLIRSIDNLMEKVQNYYYQKRYGRNLTLRQDWIINHRERVLKEYQLRVNKYQLG